jgi:archaellum biogenesis ATPase FlaH
MEFDFDKTTGKFTYRNEVTKTFWPAWKKWDELTEAEKKQMNLGIPARKYIVFDIDLKESTEEEILLHYHEFREKLINKEITAFLADRSPHGYHIYAPFEKLDTFSDELIEEVRRIFVKGFGADEAKVSLNGVISIPGKPHFKTNKVLPILDYFEGINELKTSTINIAKENIENNKRSIELMNQISGDSNDEDSLNFFSKDEFWKYLKKRKELLPLGTSRNNIVLKNLAIASARSGLSNEKVQDKIQELLTRLMPDIPYKVFEGWYKKALTGELKEYNKWEINKWAREYSNETEDIYDLKGIILDLDLDEDVKKLILELNNPNKSILLDERDSVLKRIAKIKDVIIREYLVGKVAYALMITKKTIFDEIRKIENYKEESKPISAFDLCAKEYIENEYYIDKILPKGKNILIGGKGGKGKSLFVLAMCLGCKSENSKFINKFETKEDPAILYYDLENGEDRNSQRLQYMMKDQTFKKNATPFNFSFDFNKKDLEKELLRCRDYDIIVLDSFRRFLQGSENDSEITNDFFLNFLKRLNEMGKTVIIIHHLKKVKLGEIDDEDLLDAFRGSTDIVALFDNAYLVTKGNETISLNNKTMRFDLSINLGVKNRDGNISNNLMIQVTKDDTLRKTTFKSSEAKKMLNYKDKTKRDIIEFVKEQKECKRKEIIAYIKESSDLTEFSIIKYVEELVQSSQLCNSRFGVYSIVPEINGETDIHDNSDEVREEL